MAAPDFVGLESAIPLIELKPEVVGIAAKLKGLGNRLCDVVVGRTTHPVSIQVGGIAVLPDKKKLAAIRQELEAAVPDLHATADLFHTFKIPAFARETEFVSLKGEKNYPWIGGRLLSTDKVDKPEAVRRLAKSDGNVRLAIEDNVLEL